MNQQPVIINYSLGESRRRKQQQKDFSLASTPWVTAGQASINATQPVEQELDKYTPLSKKVMETTVDGKLDPIYVLSKALKVVLEAQEFMYDTFDKYRD